MSWHCLTASDKQCIQSRVKQPCAIMLVLDFRLGVTGGRSGPSVSSRRGNSFDRVTSVCDIQLQQALFTRRPIDKTRATQSRRPWHPKCCFPQAQSRTPL
jgi:hypothetical protein